MLNRFWIRWFTRKNSTMILSHSIALIFSISIYCGMYGDNLIWTSNHSFRSFSIALILSDGLVAFSYVEASSSFVEVIVICICARSLSRTSMYSSVAIKSDFETIKYHLRTFLNAFRTLYVILWIFSTGWKQSVIHHNLVIWFFGISLAMILYASFKSMNFGFSGCRNHLKSSNALA